MTKTIFRNTSQKSFYFGRNAGCGEKYHENENKSNPRNIVIGKPYKETQDLSTLYVVNNQHPGTIYSLDVPDNISYREGPTLFISKKDTKKFSNIQHATADILLTHTDTQAQTPCQATPRANRGNLTIYILSQFANRCKFHNRRRKI